MQEKIPAVATLDDSYLPETKLLPPTYEKEKPTIVLSDSYLPETKLLPPTYEKEKPTIVLSDDADTDSENSSKPIDLPLPEAIFEEDNTDNESEDLPFIWEEDVPEEEPKEEFYDDDLPTLLDAPEVTLGDEENTQAFDIPQTNILEPQLPEIDLAQQDKPAENETLPKVESVEPENTQSENVKTQWVFKKDYRKLMDFNENFDGFPKSESDVFNNPARYQYDNENLVEQGEKKIDNSIGNKLFEKAKNYIKSNEADKATKLLEELLHYNFDVPQTEYFLALAEFKNGNHNRAEKYLERSNRRNKDPYLQSRNTELVGEIAFSQGKYAEAYKNFINAVVGVNSKHDAQLYNKAGIAALRAGDIENARRAWKTGSYLGNKDAKRNLIWLDH
jgi:tetratricopeptide (TPR) repeat protein